MVPSIPLLSYESSVSVKENPDRKKSIFGWWYANSILQKIEKELGINSRKASKLIPKLYSGITKIVILVLPNTKIVIAEAKTIQCLGWTLKKRIFF